MNNKRIFMLGVCVAGLAGLDTSYAQGGVEADGNHQSGTELVILGGAAGRTSYGGHPSGGFSAALVVGDDHYIVDFGRGWHDRYYEAGLGTEKASSGFSGLENIKAAFVTHLHSDHIIDLPRLLLFGSTEGLRKKDSPVRIVGPASRGELPPVSESLKGEEVLVNPESPTPGMSETVEKIFSAYASDLNDNIRDSGMPHPSKYINVEDIQLPDGIPGPQVNVSPDMDPFEVYRDDNVVVTATLVNHAPMYPSYAYRFDTADGSVVFSGDTNKNDNLIRMAKDADVLVHEVISTEWANSLFPEPRSAAEEAKLHHLLESHTPVEEVGEVAEEAQVGHLVLSHLAPATVSDEDWLRHVSGFSGEVVIGRPLTRVVVGD
ncbi:MBL fold metallo-hydrolase [Halomonas sp. M4R5S39]|uniref:MBL fold metallo-hydrolase n=1 Tax=Halomonas kalidii TaxID=3043293 RepID=UPI0024A81858|nr:MBL fold metallo-hydrolase [Halomonas kalidii]MDI5986039.1 MBL fold metallo-hydrolase [Halomonas kalidii]